MKSDFYAVNDITQGEQRVCTLFGTRDNAFHAKLRAPVQKYYKVSELLKLEHRVDRVIEDFCSKLEQRFANPGKPCDIAEWFLFCESLPPDGSVRLRTLTRAQMLGMPYPTSPSAIP